MCAIAPAVGDRASSKVTWLATLTALRGFLPTTAASPLSPRSVFSHDFHRKDKLVRASEGLPKLEHGDAHH